SDNYFLGTFKEFLQVNPAVLNESTITAISKNSLSDHKVKSVVKLLGKHLATKDRQKKSKVVCRTSLSLLRLLTSYAMAHPIWYKSIRGELYKWSLFEQDKEIRDYAKRTIVTMRSNFRKWLGQNQQIAVDSDTGAEYGWSDVMTFDDSIDASDKARLATAIESAPLIREAIFLFTRGTLIRLQDMPSKGIWVSFLGSKHGKSVFRVSVQTRHSGSFDLAINLNQSLKKSEIASEIEWLVAAGADENRDQLVEDFGGFWPEYDLWTEEFIPGDTVSKFFEKQSRQTDRSLEHRAQLLWPYMVWNGLRAYVDFWCRTGRSLVIADPSPDNVIVPPHDYHTGSRIVSISHRQPFESILKLITSFYRDFVQKIQQSHKRLKRPVPWDSIFSAFLEVLDETEGLQLLKDTVSQTANGSQELPAAFSRKLSSFIKSVEKKGFRPQRLHFAIKRFERWMNLNPEAIPHAQMQTLQELSSTYGLENLETSCPGTRIQYFRDTVFAQSEKSFIKALDQLVLFQKQQNLLFDRLANRVSELRGSFQLNEAEAFFLTRMTYPHLGPSDAAELISITEEGTQKTDLVVFVKDQYSNVLSIRHPATPKEIAHLHRLFIQANLPLEFQSEHEFLVVLDEKAHVVGGLFYRRILDTTVHLEKIVVAPTHRKHGISDGLLNEFFNRLQNEGVRIVTVGFLRPEFFYRFGFKIDHRYGNMVKRLDKSQVGKTVVNLAEALS
ncbi:GNAT family N-acetyltransferase, partial [bacterium]|nr:GNAT family N-acetyltransferase [bacterium]